MKRRTILKGGIILAATAHTAASAPTLPKDHTSIYDFLAKALPAEKARYHANALAEAMNELKSGQYRAEISHDYGFALVVDDSWKKNRIR
ncbi:hypothetical protein [Agrobacterium pusense]|uniref:hypothetical protein n=1 Tax=Agrobacterium pusense TaxID=648995 RepID=UPI000D1AC678|nr:hypothetical protein [Agrobacterium pusense]